MQRRPDSKVQKTLDRAFGDAYGRLAEARSKRPPPDDVRYMELPSDEWKALERPADDTDADVTLEDDDRD